MWIHYLIFNLQMFCQLDRMDQNVFLFAASDEGDLHNDMFWFFLISGSGWKVMGIWALHQSIFWITWTPRILNYERAETVNSWLVGTWRYEFCNVTLDVKRFKVISLPERSKRKLSCKYKLDYCPRWNSAVQTWGPHYANESIKRNWILKLLSKFMFSFA